MLVHYFLDETGYPYISWVGEHRPGCLTATIEELNAIVAAWHAQHPEGLPVNPE
jgi:hypothetical protein